MEQLVPEKLCDNCGNKIENDESIRLKVVFEKIPYWVDVCHTCVSNLLTVRAGQADFRCDRCDFEGKNERSLRMHRTRTGH